jgi:hypothetical protein
LPQEHDDDLTPSVDERRDMETEDYPYPDEESEDNESDDQVSDDDIVGKLGPSR